MVPKSSIGLTGDAIAVSFRGALKGRKVDAPASRGRGFLCAPAGHRFRMGRGICAQPAPYSTSPQFWIVHGPNGKDWLDRVDLASQNPLPHVKNLS